MNKYALLVGTRNYTDNHWVELAAAAADVRELRALLCSPEGGNFDRKNVTVLLNKPFAEVQDAIVKFFADARKDDLLLLYFSCHGVAADNGLYLVMNDTPSTRPSGRAIWSAFIKEWMIQSGSKRQILILDCCYSGAFAHGMKGSTQVPAITDATFQGSESPPKDTPLPPEKGV